MLRCLLVDDEEHAIDILRYFVNQCDGLVVEAATTSAIEALNIARSQEIDLVFMDINMPDISGLDLARSLPRRCKVIFTTAYAEHAVAGYELGIVDYLLKPVSYHRFVMAVEKAQDLLLRQRYQQPVTSVVNEPRYVYVKTGIKHSVVRIDLEEIDYIEGLQNYVGIYHNKKRTLAYVSMKDLETQLPAEKFLRVHKSYIVALQRIARVDANEIHMAGNEQRIAIGELYRNKLWERIRDHTIG
jgi:two-component system LytT family response regulator